MHGYWMSVLKQLETEKEEFDLLKKDPSVLRMADLKMQSYYGLVGKVNAIKLLTRRLKFSYDTKKKNMLLTKKKLEIMLKRLDKGSTDHKYCDEKMKDIEIELAKPATKGYAARQQNHYLRTIKMYKSQIQKVYPYTWSDV